MEAADIRCMDAIEFLASLEDESVQCIVTDPAYESLEKHRKVGTTTRLKQSKSSSNDWFSIFPNSKFEDLFTQMYRVMSKGAHLYIFSDDESAYHMKPAGEAAGFKYWKQLVWVKLTKDGNPATGMGYHYRGSNERILFFEKGKRRLSDLSVLDTLFARRITGGYPTEKPVDLVETILRQSTVEGEIVCDPFVGSGTVAVAAIGLDRGFVGNDISESAVNHSIIRLRRIEHEG